MDEWRGHTTWEGLVAAMDSIREAQPGLFRSWLRGRPEDPAWIRPALLALLALTAVAYLWALGQSGWANSFYSAAVQAATKSWKAFFYGSLDASNFITVDKPPASLWVMDLSARLFGLSAWSILVPQALEGVACVYVLYKTIRRWFLPGAALLAGLTLALTPVAAVMFRFNNPDALLVLVLTLSAYALTRALEAGKNSWLIAASALIGLGFLTKMLAAFIIIPGFVLVYLLFAPVSWRRRIGQIFMSAATVIVCSGWWVAIVQLTPAANRPYIDNSTNNSILNLIFGYNGLGRLTGNEFGGSGGVGFGAGGANAGHFGGGGSAFGGGIGIARVFGSSLGGQISWLIPAALVLAVFAAWFVHRHWREDRTLAALVLWTATLVVTGLVFSLSQGIVHSYYTVAMAPSVGALIGIGIDVLWRRRDDRVARAGLILAILAAAGWSFVLLNRSPQWYPWLRTTILVAGGVAAGGMALGSRLNRQLFWGAAVTAMAAGLAGPAAYTLDAVTTPQAGASPAAGPNISAGLRQQFLGGERLPQLSGRFADFRSQPGGVPPGAGAGFPSNFHGGFEGGANQKVVKLIEKSAAHYTWVAATVGATASSPYQLATGDPVMAIGGFMGSDSAPTLAKFKQYVHQGKIHYFIGGGNLRRGSFPQAGGLEGQGPFVPSSGRFGQRGEFGLHGRAFAADSPFSHGEFSGGGFGGFGRSGTASAITQWVESHFQSRTVGGVTLYNLSKPTLKSSG